MWEIEWWHWAVLGGVLLVLDIFLLNIYYLLWFGIAAAFMAGVLAAFPQLEIYAQILMFAGFSAALLALWLLWEGRRSAKKRAAARRELPGLAGVVIRHDPKKNTGEMRLQKPVGGSDVWGFAADFPVANGERVTIARLRDDNVAELQNNSKSIHNTKKE